MCDIVQVVSKLHNIVMAESLKKDVSTVLDDITKEITCPHCSKELRNPKLLTCQHAYCTRCLEELAAKQYYKKILCPECNECTQLMAAGIYGLHRAEQKIALKKEKEKFLAKIVRKKKFTLYCTHHLDSPCDIYCHDCTQSVCRDCILLGGKHFKHKFQRIEIVAKRVCQAYETELLSLSRKKEEIKHHLEAVDENKKALHKNYKDACQQISRQYDEIIQIIEAKKKDDVDHFRKNYEAGVGLKEMDSHIKYVCGLHGQIESIERRANQHDKTESDLLFMESQKELLREIRETNQFIQRVPMEPPCYSTASNLKLTMSQELVSEMMEAIQQKLPTYSDPLKCTVQVYKGTVNQLSSVTITIKDSRGSLYQIPQEITVELHSLRKKDAVIRAKVDMKSPSCYIAQYRPTPLTRGRCQLLVNICGDRVHTENVFIECPPTVQLEKPFEILRNIVAPGCLKAIPEGILMIERSQNRCVKKIDFGNRLSVVASNFEVPKRYSKWDPIEITTSNEFIFVTDCEYNMVHKFSAKLGKHIASVGRCGINMGEFKGPNGICLVRDKIYICDTGNHRIQVLNEHLEPVLCFGCKGRLPGQFNCPDNIAFDETSRQIFITELKNNRIQCLNLNGEHIRFIGSEPGELIKPNILHLADNHIYVTDNKGVSIFDLSGNFIFCFAKKCSAIRKKCINGFTIDEDGYRYVSDEARNRVVIF